MTATRYSGWLLAGLLLTSLPAVAQKMKENNPSSKEAKSTPATAQPNLDRVKQRIFSLTNRFRVKQGRHPLRTNKELTRAAQYFAEYLARTDEFSHTADGKEPWDRVARFGYPYSIVAENIAWEYSSEGFKTRELADKFIAGWKKSPGHRKNMLDPDVEEIGVGVAKSKKTGRYYAVQDFARPKSSEFEFQITNETGRTMRYKVDGKEFSLRPNYTVTHTRSRPPKVTFETGEESSRKEQHVYHPGANDHFFLREENGRVFVEEE